VFELVSIDLASGEPILEGLHRRTRVGERHPASTTANHLGGEKPEEEQEQEGEDEVGASFGPTNSMVECGQEHGGRFLSEISGEPFTGDGIHQSGGA
jgi:hypothetical protein